MTPEEIIRMEPIPFTVQLAEYATRFVWQFPPFRIAGKIETEDGPIYCIEWLDDAALKAVSQKEEA